MKFPGNIGEILQQAQKMQQQFSDIQAELQNKTVSASSGGGMVSVTINGVFQVVDIRIESSVVNPADIEMLQDLVQAAINEALRKAKDLMKEEMKKLTGGLPIPGFS